MKLTERDRQILTCIEHRANQPISSYRSRIGYKDHTIRHHMNNLRSRGVIVGQAPFINMYRLGYTDYTFFFSLAPEHGTQRDRFIKKLLSAEHVSWLALVGGDYQYGVSLCVKQSEDALAQLKKLSLELGNMLSDKALSLRISFCAFGKKFLAGKAGVAPPLRYGGRGAPVEIDEIDHRILCGLANTEYSSNRELARNLDVPFTTLERRLRNLERDGVIVGYIYRFNAAKLGNQIYKLLVYARGVDPSLSERLYKFSHSHLNVINFSECLGAWDYELGVEVEKPEDVTEVVRQLYDRFGKEISSVRMLQVFRHLRFSCYPFE